ncbi:hypothetical protein BDV06DRAFT_184536 [Aspergillus oleicola]
MDHKRVWAVQWLCSRLQSTRRGMVLSLGYLPGTILQGTLGRLDGMEPVTSGCCDRAKKPSDIHILVGLAPKGQIQYAGSSSMQGPWGRMQLMLG